MDVSKERIISEIRRLAAASNGDPPGTQAFKRATGIKESEWRGRHWVNWGQALTEAGYTPNSWVVQIPEDVLLENLAIHVRALGRYPVDAELKIRRRSDENLPAPEVLRNRFGSTQATVDALLRYARNRGDTILAAICENWVAAQTRKREKASSYSTERGSVYLVKSGPFCKIGRERDVNRTTMRCPEDCVAAIDQAATGRVGSSALPAGSSATV
jgi:hypothetical protein